MGSFKKILYLVVTAVLLILLIKILFFGIVWYSTDYLNKQIKDSLDCQQINKSIQYYEGITDTTKAGFIMVNNKEYNDWETGYYDKNYVETKTDKLTVNCVQVYGTEAKKQKWNAVAGVWKHYFCDSADGDKIGVIEKTVEVKVPNLFKKMQKISGKQEKQTVTFVIKQTIVNEYDENKNFVKTYCKRVETEKKPKKQ